MRNKTIREPKSQTLYKAVLVLDCFTLVKPEWGIRELARELGMTPTTIYNLVSTLTGSGYLEQNPETQRYTLGPKVIKLASIYSHINPLPHTGQKVFEKYSEIFEYNFYLGRLKNFEVIYLTVLDGRGPIKIVVEPGGSTSLHSTALGKTLLAYQDESFIQEYLSRVPLTPFTKRTITDPDILYANLLEIRAKGYSINNGEHYETIGAVGVPIINGTNKVTLGVSLAYPLPLFNSENLNLDKIINLAHEVAAEIASRIKVT